MKEQRPSGNEGKAWAKFQSGREGMRARRVEALDGPQTKWVLPRSVKRPLHPQK